MSAGFTPGPWSLYQHFATPMPDRFDVVGATRDDDIADNVTKSNAHLIAAAPDLYEALDNLAANIGEAFPALTKLGPLVVAYQALAKARGETA